MESKKKLIYADELLAAICDDRYINGANFAKFKRHIDEQTTVDAVEVVHGRWVFRKNWDFFVCSQCSNESSSYSNYCPNCGANMMDGGNEDGK